MPHTNDKIQKLSLEQQDELVETAFGKLKDSLWCKNNQIEYHAKPTIGTFYQAKRACFYELHPQEKNKTA